MKIYQKLYRIERKAKRDEMSEEQRYQLRLQYSKPIIVEFKQWLDQHYPLVPPKSPIGKAIKYVLKHWEGLIRYLDNGRLEIDNNHTEQEIKPFVIARKNFLFAYSQRGAKALCLHFSLIRTAKLRGLDPYRYYVSLLEMLPHCKTIEDYEALRPWNIQLNESSYQLSA